MMGKGQAYQLQQLPGLVGAVGGGGMADWQCRCRLPARRSGEGAVSLGGWERHHLATSWVIFDVACTGCGFGGGLGGRDRDGAWRRSSRPGFHAGLLQSSAPLWMRQGRDVSGLACAWW